MDVVQSINLISINPKVRGGRPCIVGTGLRVTDVAIAHLFHQRIPSDIASDYALSLAQVHAALAYYYEHKAELDEDIRQQIAKAKMYQERQVGGNESSLLSG
jgi:uncharacterized protein (DUF433 family)